MLKFKYSALSTLLLSLPFIAHSQNLADTSEWQTIEKNWAEIQTLSKQINAEWEQTKQDYKGNSDFQALEDKVKELTDGNDGTASADLYDAWAEAKVQWQSLQALRDKESVLDSSAVQLNQKWQEYSKEWGAFTRSQRAKLTEARKLARASNNNHGQFDSLRGHFYTRMTGDTAQIENNDTDARTVNNRIAIQENQSAIENNTRAIQTNKSTIETNTHEIQVNKSAIEANTNAIQANQTDIRANTQMIQRNTADIAQTRDQLSAIQNTVGKYSQRIENVEKQIRKVEKKASAGTAAAMAVGMLTESKIAGHPMVSVAATTYDGQQGGAVGMSYLSPQGKVTTKAAVTFNSQSKFGAGVAAGYQF